VHGVNWVWRANRPDNYCGRGRVSIRVRQCLPLYAFRR